MPVSKAQRDALKAQKKQRLLDNMQKKPKPEDNVVDQNLEAYTEIITENIPNDEIPGEQKAEPASTPVSVTADAGASDDQNTPEGNTDNSKQESTDTDIPVKADKADTQKKVQPKKETKSSGKKKQTPPISERYTGVAKTTTLLLSPELDEYLYFRAIEESKAVKTLIKELLINEIDNGTPEEDMLIRQYRRPQKETVKKCVQIESDLQNDIRKTAIKYHLKYTSFIAYALDKARLASQNVK